MSAHRFEVHPPEEGCASHWSVWEIFRGTKRARVYVAANKEDAQREATNRKTSVFTRDGKLEE